MSAVSAPEGLWRRAAALLRRPFVRDVGKLQFGNFVWLGLSFVLSIALARLLGPVDYGAYALVVSTFTTISLFKRLGQDYVATTDLAAGCANGDASATGQALVFYNWVNLWSTVLVIPIALGLAPLVTGIFFGAPELGAPLRLALLPPIWAMVLGTYMLALQATRRIGRLALVENGNQVVLAISGVLAAARGLGVSGVFLGQALASAAIAVLAAVAYTRLARRDRLLPSFADQWRGIVGANTAVRAALLASFRSGLAIALDKNLVSLYALAPVLLLGAFAPTDQVAHLRVALSYVVVPTIAFSAISRVLMVEFPALHATRPERVQPFFLRVTIVGGLVSFATTAPFVLLAPLLIGGLWGADYAPAAVLVPYLALDPALAGFGIAAGPIFRTYRRNMLAVYANLAILAVGLPLAAWATAVHGLPGAALAYALMVTALRAVAYLLCLRIVSRSSPT